MTELSDGVLELSRQRYYLIDLVRSCCRDLGKEGTLLQDGATDYGLLGWYILLSCQLCVDSPLLETPYLCRRQCAGKSSIHLYIKSFRHRRSLSRHRIVNRFSITPFRPFHSYPVDAIFLTANLLALHDSLAASSQHPIQTSYCSFPALAVQ